jgi:putative protease
MSEEQSLRGQKGLEYFFNSGNINPMEVKIGTVSHVYKKIGVAIVELSEPLQAGDTIHISGHHTDLTQKVESMQAEHQNLQKAEPGQSVGLKVTGEVREHDLVYKVVD